MSLDKNDVHKIAFLSRLSLNEAEETHYAQELSAIVDWFEELKGADTDNIEPMVSPTENPMAWRDDVVTAGNLGETLTASAPDAKYGYYAVPKVVE